MQMLKPGVRYQDLSATPMLDAKISKETKIRLPDARRWLCDEWPLVAYPGRMVEGAFDHELEPGMVLCWGA
jgi:hypothetical protein